MTQPDLAQLPGRTVYAAGHRIEIYGDVVLVDGIAKTLTPAPAAALRALAEYPGGVVARDELRKALPGNTTSAHAVEMVVQRLRVALGDKEIVATVVKRGYRLSVDEPGGAP